MTDFIKTTKLPGVFLIERPLFADERGFFKEIFRARDLEEKLGYQFRPVQASHSHSKKDVLRGIHVAPWSKLVYVTQGQVQQVVVDLRPDSKTFKQHLSLVLGEEERRGVFIPPNCGNAYLVLAGSADYIYLISDYWQAGKEQTLAWDDLTLKIPWRIKSPLLSDKDASASGLDEFLRGKTR